MKKKIFKLTVLLLVFAILIPFLTNFLYGLILNYLPGKMYVNDSDTWINFLGGFLGAGLTLIGIFWQIEESKNEKNEELISNTYVTYQLLESELVSLCSTTIAIKMICKNFGNISEGNSAEQRTFKAEIFEVLKTFENKHSKQDTIYNYISQSLPKEKINLIKSSNSIFTTSHCINKIIKNLDIVSNLETISESNDVYISSLKKDLKEHKTNQASFEKNIKNN